MTSVLKSTKGTLQAVQKKSLTQFLPENWQYVYFFRERSKEVASFLSPYHFEENFGWVHDGRIWIFDFVSLHGPHYVC